MDKTTHRFTSLTTEYGFLYVNEAAGEIEDHIDLNNLTVLVVDLNEIVCATQPTFNLKLAQKYATTPPKTFPVLCEHDDDIAVFDGHHTIIGARLRGDKTITCLWAE